MKIVSAKVGNMRDKLSRWVMVVHQFSQSVTQSLRTSLISMVARTQAAPRTVRMIWWTQLRRTRVRFLSGVMAIVSFGVYFAITGVIRYIVFGVGLMFLLCIALPGIPGGLLELLGFRLGRVRDRSGWAIASLYPSSPSSSRSTLFSV